MPNTPRTPRKFRNASGRARAVNATAVSLWLGNLHIAASVPQSYIELRHCLHTFIRCRRAGLLSEARQIFRQTYAHLLGRPPHSRDEAGFPLLMANLLRQTLIAHARAQNKSAASLTGIKTGTATLMDIDAVLMLLETRDAHTARIVELYYFAGLQPIDIGTVLLLEPAAATRTLRAARAWLIAQLVERTAVKDG